MISEDASSFDTDKAHVADLELFVVENDDLLELESLIGRFNFFDALGIEKAEIRHSNFLAFILDPAESHGQGQIFLKAILMDLLKKAPARQRPLSPIEIDGTDLRGVEVRREWQHIDLLITCKEPQFLVVVENKIMSGEGADQLTKYEQTMNEHYAQAKPLYVYLTLEGDEASRENWMSYSHADIHRVLSHVRESHKDSIGKDVAIFLDHYLNLLGIRFMNDKRIDDLCKQIYTNHRRALDLIRERAMTAKSGVLAEVESLLKEDGRWQVDTRGNSLIFVPRAWVEWLPKFGLRGDYWSDPWWIHVCIYSDRGKLICCMHVGRLADFAKRKEIVTKLLAEIPRCNLKRPKSREIKDNLSRIMAGECIIQWDEADEPEPNEVRDKATKALDNLYPKLEKLATVLKPLCEAGNIHQVIL